jgi:MOSC domain-containing protein YiiM
MAGRVEGIWIADEREAPTLSVEEVSAVAGKGLEGDRNFGDHSGDEPGRDLTLIEAEAIAGLAADTGIELGPGQSRRNVVTRGIGLNDLVGRHFRVGELECLGVELCEPCRHLERLTHPGVLKGLVHRGGLRADITKGGTIRVGDAVASVPED